MKKHLILFISICSLSFISEARLHAARGGRFEGRASLSPPTSGVAASVAPCVLGDRSRAGTSNGGFAEDRVLLKGTGRPQMQDSVRSPSGRFLMHFDRMGEDAVSPMDEDGNGVPDYIDCMGAILDHVWEVEIDSLGFPPPLDSGGGCCDAYPVYFLNMGTMYGHTFLDEEIPGDQPALRYTCYTVLDNDYVEEYYSVRELDAARVTAAHEFNHAIQLSCGLWLEDGRPVDLYLMEMTATWVEDVVYDGVNRYLEYLPVFFENFSNQSFTCDEGLFPYGNSLFFHMLEKKLGPSAIVDIWGEIGFSGGLSAIQDVLAGYGTTFPSQLHRYAEWLSYTGPFRWVPEYLPEGEMYPNLYVDPVDSFAMRDELVIASSIAPYASRILQVEVESAGDFRCRTTDGTGRIWVGYLIENHPLVSLQHDSEFMVYLHEDSRLKILLTNPVAAETDVEVALWREFQDHKEVAVVYPNPVLLETHDTATFANLPRGGAVHVFTADGVMVNTIPVPHHTTHVAWDLTDRHGDPVSSGVYVYLVEGWEEEDIGKFMVVH